MIMGRRARTNCSPVDAVLEKYHNDIGNRLSGVFVPPPNVDGPQGLSEDFCMLTLNLRRSQSLKCRPKGQFSASPLREEDNTANLDGQKSADASPALRRAAGQETEMVNAPAPSDQEASNKDKTRLVDKLTRALFQKRHICARCKRKSRSCVLNKNFSGTEKHYTCGRCRDNSSALKNFFDAQGEKQVSSACTPLSSSSSPALKAGGSVQPQPRACNDSGYDTVTSCSTVASSYSAFNTSNSKNVSTKDNASSQENSDSSSFENHSSNQPCGSHNSRLQHPEQTSQAPCFPGSGPCPHHQHQPCADLRLPQPADYDGYLPDFIEFRGWNRLQVNRPCSQSDAACGLTQEEEEEESGGVMILRRPTSLDSSALPGHKACHTCGSTSAPCFRLPWEGGWLCEDCLDGIY